MLEIKNSDVIGKNQFKETRRAWIDIKLLEFKYFMEFSSMSQFHRHIPEVAIPKVSPQSWSLEQYDSRTDDCILKLSINMEKRFIINVIALLRCPSGENPANCIFIYDK